MLNYDRRGDMKKFKFFLCASALAVTGGALLSLTPINLTQAATEELVTISITSEEQFARELKNNDNYIGHRFVLENNLDFSGKEDMLTGIWAQSRVFQGEFDGNGFTISNLTFTSSNQYFGLFGYASSGAVIQNLRLDGIITYEFNPDKNDQIYAGNFIAYGDNITVQDCEIGKDTQIRTVEVGGTEYAGLKFSTKITYGNFAGTLVNASNITNCVNHANINAYSLLTATSVAKIGGIVGRMNNSSATFVANYGNIGYQADSVNVTFYNGGIAGEAEGNNSKLINTAYSGLITKINGENNATGLSGGVIGSISMSSWPNSGNISFNYWTQDISAFGRQGDYIILDASKVTKVSALGTQFFLNGDNWHKLYPSWNFDYIWIAKSDGTGTGSQLFLQYFQNFHFSFAELLDSGAIIDAENSTFEGGKSTYKYGDNVVINLMFKPQFQGFYVLHTVLLDSVALTDDIWSAQPILDVSGKLTGYKVALLASNMTDGVYSFALKPINFNCLVETENMDKGGVKYKGGSQMTSSLPINLTLESNAQTVVAEAKGIYTFDSWDLYYVQENEQGDESWKIAQENFNSNSNLQIKFGNAPFDQRFKLVANFTDANAVSVTFRKEENVTAVQFSGQDYQGEGIKVSGTGTKIDLLVTIKEGFEIDLERFTAAIARMYGENDTSTLMPTDPVLNEDKTLTYRFVINMRHIKETLQTNEVEIVFYTQQSSNDEGDSLLWLWITLPIVGVLVIGGISLYFILRNYFYKHGGGKGNTPGTKGKVKKKVEKEPDYKDYYI